MKLERGLAAVELGVVGVDGEGGTGMVERTVARSGWRSCLVVFEHLPPFPLVRTPK